MRTVLFNNISFDSLGLILRKTPVPPCSQDNYDTISIPNGPVIFDNKKTRDPIQFPIECTLIKDGMLRDIYAMVQERGKLVLPDEPDKYYNARLAISTPKNIILQYNHIVFNAICEPYAYSVENEMETYTLSSGGWFNYASVMNKGTEEAEPLIRVSTPYSFDIWTRDVGDTSNVCKFSLDGPDTITIDVQNEIAYNSAGQIILNRMQGDFKKLKLAPGLNQISATSISSMYVRKNERWF